MTWRGSRHHHCVDCTCAEWLRRRDGGSRMISIARRPSSPDRARQPHIGFAACLEDVLIKVSGALKLAGDPRLAAYKSRAEDFVNA